MSGCLEARFPHLSGERIVLGSWPTPVTAVDVAGARLWCKQEGWSAPSYGGNKVRKLEWILPRVRGRAVITFGAAGSNHVIATCVFGAKVGSRVHAVVVPQPATETARRNATAIERLAHEVWPAHSELGAVLALCRAAARSWREEGRRPAVVWVGGTSPWGVLGWVNGALEIAAQVEAGELPEPDRVFVPLGTGGVAAGLLLGFGLTRLRTRVHAVRVADRLWANHRLVLMHARRARALLGEAAPPPDPRRLAVDDRWFGPGYGVPTAEGAAAAQAVSAAGIAVDPTYTAKTWAAALAAAQRERPGAAILVVSTVNAVPLERAAGEHLGSPEGPIARLLTPL